MALRIGVLAYRTNRVPSIFFDWHVSHPPLAGVSYSVSPKPFKKITPLDIEPKLPEGIIIWFIVFFLYLIQWLTNPINPFELKCRKFIFTIAIKNGLGENGKDTMGFLQYISIIVRLIVIIQHLYNYCQ